MGTMKIRVDAPPVKFAFTWECSQNDIENTMTFIEDRAEEAGVTPEQFTQGVLRHLPTTGIMKDEGARAAQMMAIAYAVLTQPVNTPGRPGAVYRYAANEHIVAVLAVTDRGMDVYLSGQDEDEDEDN
jgi:hypothetical protein